MYTIALITSAIVFASLYLGFLRKKAIYGYMIIISSTILRICAFEVGNDLWLASCIFMFIGACYCFYPTKDLSWKK